MIHSHPEKWRYGGIMVRVEWKSDSDQLHCWDGAVRQVRHGDTLVALMTATGLTPVEVERRSVSA